MRKRLTAFLLFAALALTMLVPVHAEVETVVFSCSFDDESAQGELFDIADASVIEWASGAGMGHGDDTVLKVSHIEGETYTSANNAVLLTFDKPLPAGGVYHVTAWFFAPAELNQGKGTMTGPGIVINGEYAGAQGETKFPPDFGTLPAGEWMAVDVVLPVMQTRLKTLNFRLVINEADKHPDVWYLDDITITQVGELQEVTVPEWDLSLASLAEAYSDYFLLGNIIEPNQVSDEEMSAMYTHYYNVMTAENTMKPVSLAPRKGEYNFAGADALVNWAEENNIQVHGHTLVWHSQSPDWLNKGADGSALTRAEAKANMEEYINEVAGRYAGRLLSWDVVNEAFDNSPQESGDWRAALRKDSPWYRAYANGAGDGESGADYIYDAYVFARLADPTAQLYYNDFNETETGKRRAIAEMVENINAQWKDDERNTEPDRLLIEGIGMQAHYWVQGFDTKSIEDSIVRFAQTGAKISVAELDIPFGNWSNYTNRGGEYTEEEEQQQAECYKQAFEIYMKYADSIDRVTFWGKADPQSWRAEGAPLLFDRVYYPKDAFWAVLGVVDPDAVPSDNPAPDEEPSPAGEQPDPTEQNPAPAEPTPVSATPQGGGDTDEPGGSTWVIIVIVAVVIVAGGAFFVIKRGKK